MSQYHVLLENPRAGVMQLPAFESGDKTPQTFVPLAMETYMGMHGTYGQLTIGSMALVDKFRYQGSMDKFVKERVSDKIGVDLSDASARQPDRPVYVDGRLTKSRPSFAASSTRSPPSSRTKRR